MDYLGEKGFYEEPAAEAVLDWEWLRQLIALVEREDLAELVVSQGRITIVVRGRSYRPPIAYSVPPTGSMTMASSELVVGEEVQTEEASSPSLVTDRLFYITAPLTGVFYSRPRPDAPPFVTVGSIVEPGQTVALVEAMKFFNEVRSEVRGIVREILPKDQQLVKLGDTLIVLERLD